MRPARRAPLDTDPPISPSIPAAPPAHEPAHWFRPLPVTTALVIVGLVVALVLTRGQLSDQRASDHGLSATQTSAIAAARTYALDVASYDYRHLARDFAKVEEESTPSFRHSFMQTSGGLTKLLLQYHAIARAKVLVAGLASITASKAVVILFVNQTVGNTAQKGGPTTDNSRIKVTLTRSGSRWILDNLKLL